MVVTEFEWWFGGVDSAIGRRFARPLEQAARGDLEY
jgi:hypothetical protein